MTAKRMFLQTHHQEHVVKGKKIAVKKAASKQGKIYVGKFKDDITEDDIREHFAQVSVSQNFCYLRPPGFFANTKSAL